MQQKQPIQPPDFVYFDLGQVLVNFSHRRAAEQIARVANIDPDLAWRVIFESDLQTKLETGLLDSETFCREFARATDSNFEYASMLQAASDIFWLNQPIVPVIEQLAASGVKMGILSNTCAAHWDHVTATFGDLLKFFPIAILSYQVGAMKPNRAIYQAAIERAGVDAGRILFVDDRAENVAGALAAGLDAHLFTTIADFRRLLGERGLRAGREVEGIR